MASSTPPADPVSDGAASVSESFNKFFESWLTEQDQHLHDLVSVTTGGPHSGSELCDLVSRVIAHYECYYRSKSRCAKQDILAMLTPAWRSTLENAFLWIGGWRPSMAFHLLYSKSGHQLEFGLDDLIRGIGTGDLGDLSPGQLRAVDDFQRETIRKERELTEAWAALQETVADSTMVEVSHATSELMRAARDEEVVGGGDGTIERKVEEALTKKEEGMERILKEADEMRMETLKGVLGILRPMQAVYFLIAAAELHLRIHEWGKKRDVEGPRSREPVTQPSEAVITA